MRKKGNWYYADKGYQFVLTEKGKEECASYLYETVGEPVNDHSEEAVHWAVEKGYVEEVHIPNWINKVGYVVVYTSKGREILVGNGTVFPENCIAEKFKKNYQNYPWIKNRHHLYIRLGRYEGIKPNEPIFHNEKQVYDNTWYFGTDTLEIGDYVTEDIVDYILNCVPPACIRTDCSQCGEPSSHRIDEKTGKTRETYSTFKQVSANVWEYCGDCFYGENVKRGKELPYV